MYTLIGGTVDFLRAFVRSGTILPLIGKRESDLWGGHGPSLQDSPEYDQSAHGTPLVKDFSGGGHHTGNRERIKYKMTLGLRKNLR